MIKNKRYTSQCSSYSSITQQRTARNDICIRRQVHLLGTRRPLEDWFLERVAIQLAEILWTRDRMDGCSNDKLAWPYGPPIQSYWVVQAYETTSTISISMPIAQCKSIPEHETVIYFFKLDDLACDTFRRTLRRTEAAARQAHFIVFLKDFSLEWAWNPAPTWTATKNVGLFSPSPAMSRLAFPVRRVRNRPGEEPTTLWGPEATALPHHPPPR